MDRRSRLIVALALFAVSLGGIAARGDWSGLIVVFGGPIIILPILWLIKSRNPGDSAASTDRLRQAMDLPVVGWIFSVGNWWGALAWGDTRVRRASLQKKPADRDEDDLT